MLDDLEPGLSGEELFRRYLDGDKNAFTALVELYEGDLAYFIKNMVQDTYETKHLVIEAFAELAVNGKRFMNRSSLKTYLFAIAKNRSMAHLKKRRRNSFLSLDEVLETAVEEGQSPEAFLEREENRTRLRLVMETLKPDYLEVLNLLYFEDMSYGEVGMVMGKTPNQVAGLAYRAKASLKKKLESEGFPHV